MKQSKMLRTVFLLVDIRHAPSANDKLMHKWIVENAMQPVIIATKKDKLKKAQVPKAIKTIRQELGLSSDTPVIAFSAETKEGREEIWAMIRSLV